jgi:hypothetical protein
VFAPAVALHLASAAPHNTPAISSTVTQATGENPLATLRLAFPPQFGFNEQFHPTRCQPSDEAAETCPAASRIGTVSAQSSLGAAAGNVYITDDFRLVAFARAYGGAIDIKAVGTVALTPDDGFAVTFGGLPNLPLQSVTLALEGGARALLKTPTACASYTLPIHMTSQDGETADTQATVPISGCAARTPKRHRHGATTLTIEKGFGLALVQKGVDAYAVAPATQDSLQFTIPVSGATLGKHGASLRSRGGMSMRHVSAGTDVTLRRIGVTLKGKRVVLSGFATIKGLGYDRYTFATGRASGIKHTRTGLRIRRVSLAINDISAAALNTEFATQDFHAGQALATASITARR